MKKLLLALMMVALIAVPAMASVQNVKVSGDIDNTYVIRENFDFAGSSQSDLIMQTRLRIDADLTDKVSATIAMINESAWGTRSADDTTGDNSANFDLNLAYVTMKEMLYSPLTVTLGRQEFAFGNSFVIDSAGTNNSAPADSGIVNIAGDLTKQTAQDAIRLTLDYDPLTVDLLYSVINQGTTGVTDIRSDGTELYGINVGYEFNDEKSTMVEGYFWVKDDNAKIYMPGVRGSMNVLDGWNLQAEVAYQFGHDDVSEATEADLGAYAAQILSNYMLPFEKTKKYQPVLGISYTMYSGDDESSDGPSNKRTGWDPMYENQAGGKIANALFNATNSHTLGASLAFVPMDDVQANTYYDIIWMDKKMSSFALVQPGLSSTVTPSAQEGDEKVLGQEVGVMLNYDYTEDVEIGANLGWFFPGAHYGNTNDSVASQILLNAKVAF